MWESKTQRFSASSMRRLEPMSAAELTKLALGYSPLWALRVLAEVMLNGADDKLAELLANRRLSTHWLRYEEDAEENALDAELAERLLAQSRG